MPTYEFTAGFVYVELNGTTYRVINVNIKTSENFKAFNDPAFSRVTDGITNVDSFRTIVSRNKKVISSIYTTDAFAVFTGTVLLEFGFGKAVLNNIEIPDINAEVLTPVFVLTTTPPDADNAWLLLNS